MTLLTVSHLSKVFNGLTAVDDVSFEAQGGEIFGLLGPNGAGKTTTIRVVATVLEATSGTASVAGFDIAKDAIKVRQNIGVLTADIGLYDRFTARENLRYFGHLYGMAGHALEQRIELLVKVLDMARFADRRAGKFSTGMKQKVAIARSIIHDPKVIIFDEPTAGLDVLASQTVISFMRSARDEGKLVVLSTHDMAHAQALCDRITIMHRSRLIATGTLPTIYQQAQATNLEEAFLHIIGADAAQQTEREREERHFAVAEQKKSRFSLWKR